MECHHVVVLIDAYHSIRLCCNGYIGIDGNVSKFDDVVIFRYNFKHQLQHNTGHGPVLKDVMIETLLPVWCGGVKNGHSLDIDKFLHLFESYK